jgi:hypothetical protein
MTRRRTIHVVLVLTALVGLALLATGAHTQPLRANSRSRDASTAEGNEEGSRYGVSGDTAVSDRAAR